MTLISPESASTIIVLDEHVGQKAAEQAVEDDGLGEREPEPLDPLQLSTELRLPGDGLDHRAEDVADANAGAERAQSDAERERDCLAGVRRVVRLREDEMEHPFPPLVLGLDRRADV